MNKPVSGGFSHFRLSKRRAVAFGPIIGEGLSQISEIAGVDLKETGHFPCKSSGSHRAGRGRAREKAIKV